MLVEVRCPECGETGMEVVIDRGEIILECSKCKYQALVMEINDVLDVRR